MLAGPGVCGDGAPAVLRSGGLEADGDVAKQCVVGGMLQQRRRARAVLSLLFVI